LMLKVRTAVMNGTLDRDCVIAERWGPPAISASGLTTPTFWTVSV
jgi:hypothetical protein